VTHTLARYQLPTTQLDRGWTSCNNLTVIDVRTGKFIATVPLDDINRGVANPWALAWTADGRNLCVSQAGSHDVTVIDFPALIAKLNRVAAARKPPPVNHVYNDLGFLEGLSVRLDLRGKGPRCMAMVGWHAYIGEYFSDSLTVLDINAIGTPLGPIVKVVPLGPKQEITAVRKGEMLFNDGKRCFQSWLSCATCHPDGRADGFRWDLLNDGLQNPKKTKSLVGAHKTAPSMVTGVRPSAEAAVRARIRTGLFATWPEADAAAVDAYLKSLKPIRSPYLVGGNLSASARRGKGLFAQARCASCHKGPYLTDMKKYDLGTGERINRNVKFDTPTLREVWRTAPYLHHGRAVSIMGVLTKFNPGDKHGVTSKLTKKQLADLAAYVLSL
jgi:mono/diheme cytochrome c family protein